ncbi:MAG: DUF4062 domain-containing protein [Deltaproteobacteria bacterium]|nr:DUF4062 domain-containing protein [Deltaproteobacteria bacterium]
MSPVEHVRILRVVVASPGDVQVERNTLTGIVEELNHGIAADRGLRLEISRWEKDAYAGFHTDGPQGLIDNLLRIKDCDIFIGIFWKRFGTPVKDAKSGTEHEFRLAYEAWQKKRSPQIMFYFKQKPYEPKSKEETDQWGQVIQFKQDFPKEGLWWSYKNKSEFEKLVRNQLSNFIRLEFKGKESSSVKAEEEPIMNIRQIQQSQDPVITNMASGELSQKRIGLIGEMQEFFIRYDEQKKRVEEYGSEFLPLINRVAVAPDINDEERGKIRK